MTEEWEEDTAVIDDDNKPDVAEAVLRVVKSVADEIMNVKSMLHRECEEARSFRVRIEAKIDERVFELAEQIGELTERVNHLENQVAENKAEIAQLKS